MEVLPTIHTQTSTLTVKDVDDLLEDRGKLEILKKFGGPENLLKQLKTDRTRGLTTDQSSNKWRVDSYGTNVLPERRYKTFWELLLDALKDTTLIILCVAAVISLVLGIAFPDKAQGETRATGWIEGASILIAVAIVSNVNAINNFQKDKQFRELEKEKDNENVFAIRDGQVIQLRTFDILVGDIISLNRGDKIPADGIMLDGKEVRVDQSSLTGESFPVQKSLTSDPFLLSGCIMADGDAHMVVLAVGIHSAWGKILVELDAEEEQTPLQEDLEDLAKKIGWAGTACAVVVFIVLTLWWVAERFIMDTVKFQTDDLSEFVQFFIIAVTIVVVAVPEGLPLAVTISLAYSMKKMMKDNNLVRHLEACETMGGVTNICTDKTGTLTENRMTVVKGWVSGSLDIEKLSDAVKPVLADAIALNSTATVRLENGSWKFLGNKTECALLVYSNKLDSDFEDLRGKFKVIKRFNFSSERKRMTTVVQTNDQWRLHCKGASEVILGLSSHVFMNGNVTEMTEDVKNAISEVINKFATGGLRTIALAYKDISTNTDVSVGEEIEKDLTFLGVFGIEDPLRQDVRDAVIKCKHAGITVRMVTGDNIETAKKIAQECGILEEGQVALEGSDFRKLAEEDVSTLKKLRVIARSTPQDKKLLVHRLKELDEVVAVTGDGTNDAIALQESHVGLAMGIEGTGVAKQASDIIILDDNFASIVKSVMWGRNVRENIQKFLQFQLTVNVVALAVAVISAVTGKGTPLKAIQLLWVNLIMDTLAALALGTEPPTAELLERPPVGRRHPLISAVMWRNIIGQSIYQLAVLFGILYGGHHLVDYEIDSREHYTFLFNAFVFCQVFNEINCRKVNKDEWNVFKGMHFNWMFLVILVVIAGGQALIVEVGGDAMKTVGLDAKKWGYSIAIGAGSLVWGFFLRFVPAPEMLCCKVKATDLDEENEPLMVKVKK